MPLATSLSIFLGGEQQSDDASDAVNHVVAHKVDRRERIRSVEVVEVWGYSGWAFRLRAAPVLALSAMISIGDDDEVNGGGGAAGPLAGSEDHEGVATGMPMLWMVDGCDENQCRGS